MKTGWNWTMHQKGIHFTHGRRVFKLVFMHCVKALISVILSCR